jgi:hypothetical protein
VSDNGEKPEIPPKSFNVQISVSGLSEQDGTTLSNVITDAIRAASEVVDLSALEGVTVTPNYRDTLARFDCGVPDQPTPDEVQEVIAYRNYNDMNDLMEFVKDRIGLVFKLAGYVLGHLAGIDRQLSDTHPEAWQSIEEAGFADTWLQLNVALKEMLDMPSWKDASVYDGLARCAINYLRTQGLYLEDQGNDFYVRVQPIALE